MAIGSLPLAIFSASPNFAAASPLRPSRAIAMMFPSANAAAAASAGSYGATSPDPPLNMKDPGRYPPPASGMSTTTKIAIAGGVVAALAIVAVIAKKRKKKRR